MYVYSFYYLSASYFLVCLFVCAKYCISWHILKPFVCLLVFCFAYSVFYLEFLVMVVCLSTLFKLYCTLRLLGQFSTRSAYTTIASLLLFVCPRHFVPWKWKDIQHFVYVEFTSNHPAIWQHQSICLEVG